LLVRIYLLFGALADGEFAVDDPDAVEYAVGVFPPGEGTLVIWKEKRIGGMEYMVMVMRSKTVVV
jgi:hypothetical protein